MDAKAVFELGDDQMLRLVYCQGFCAELEKYLKAHPVPVASTYYVAECVRLGAVITRQLDNSEMIPGAGDFGVGYFQPTFDRESGVLSGVRAEYERGA